MSASPGPTLVAGIDSSTQSCKVLIVDARTGAVVRSGRAGHPGGTEVDPQEWWNALGVAIAEAGGLEDVAALSIGGQQHGMVCLDDDGRVVRPALLWNDTRSAAAARELTDDLGGPQEWARRIGSVPKAAFTVSKVRWLAEHEPEHAGRTSAICLPHDYLTWRLSGSTDIADLVTDRSDASGTGYFCTPTDRYDLDIVRRALGRQVHLPRVAAAGEGVGVGGGATPAAGLVLGPGAGDNAAAAFGLGAEPGDVVLSVGTSGVVSAVSDQPTCDESGIVDGFADASGRYLPLACTLNGAQVLEAAATMIGADVTGLSELAMAAEPGAAGVALVPYFQGERTPNRPDASGSLLGLTLRNATAQNLARATVEGLLCGLGDGLDAITAKGIGARRILFIGGAAASPAMRAIAPAILGRPVVVPASGEYVALGAARQAAWALTGTSSAPPWELPGAEIYQAEVDTATRERYAAARQAVLPRA